MKLTERARTLMWIRRKWRWKVEGARREHDSGQEQCSLILGEVELQ